MSKKKEPKTPEDMKGITDKRFEKIVRDIHLHFTPHQINTWDSRVEAGAVDRHINNLDQYLIVDSDMWRVVVRHNVENKTIDNVVRTLSHDRMKQDFAFLDKYPESKLSTGGHVMKIIKDMNASFSFPAKVPSYKQEVYDVVFALGDYLYSPRWLVDNLSLAKRFLKEDITLKDLDREKATYSASIYVGKVRKEVISKSSQIYFDFLKQYLQEHKVDVRKISIQYCKCAREEDIKKLEILGKTELVRCEFDAGFYRALGLEERVAET